MRCAVLLASVALACSDGSEPTPAPVADTAVADAGLQPPDPVRCENACKRQPACTPEVTTEADCLAVCAKEPDPHLYACCIQYAESCAAVKACTDKTNLFCDPKGEPWLPIPLFGQCTCGDPASPTPKLSECKATTVDSPCAPAVCLKPVLSEEPAFCAIECTLDPKKCPEGTKCTETPKTWYCAK